MIGFAEVLCFGLCKAQLVENACLHPPLSHVFFFVVLVYPVQVVFTCGHNMVIIGVTILRLLR